MRPLHYFIGVEVHQNSSDLSLTQGKYATELLVSIDNLQICCYASGHK